MPCEMMSHAYFASPIRLEIIKSETGCAHSSIRFFSILFHRVDTLATITIPLQLTYICCSVRLPFLLFVVTATRKFSSRCDLWLFVLEIKTKSIIRQSTAILHTPTNTTHIHTMSFHRSSLDSYFVLRFEASQGKNTNAHRWNLTHKVIYFRMHTRNSIVAPYYHSFRCITSLPINIPPLTFTAYLW